MDENDNVLVVKYEAPSVKDQFVASGVAIAASLACGVIAYCVTVGVSAAWEQYQGFKNRRAAKKLAKQEEK